MIMPKTKQPKQHRIAKTKTVTIKPFIVTLGARLADEDVRSFSNLIEILIIKEARDRGIKIPELAPELPFKK